MVFDSLCRKPPLCIAAIKTVRMFHLLVGLCCIVCFYRCEEAPPDPDPCRTPVPSCRCPSVLSEPPAYSSKDQFSSRSNSSLSLGPSLPDSFRYLSLVGSSQLSPSSPPLWSPLHVYRSPSAPMSPPPPPYQHPLEQALSNSCD